MSFNTPVDSITALLKQAGYRLLPTPLEIAGMKFNVTAALVGTGSTRRKFCAGICAARYLRACRGDAGDDL